MKKDFQKWHKKKENVNELQNRPFFHEREIWFCYLGVNVGYEQDGGEKDFIRPVIVFKKFNNEIFWAIPLTKSKNSNKKRFEKYYFRFSFLSEIESLAILSQIRLVDAKRLSRHIGTISKSEFSELKKKLKDLFP